MQRVYPLGFARFGAFSRPHQISLDPSESLSVLPGVELPPPSMSAGGENFVVSKYRVLLRGCYLTKWRPQAKILQFQGDTICEFAF